jgi:F0F1-type ATP synthase assembly protein I
MSQQSPPPASAEDRPAGDPWHAFGYVVSGVGVYGVLGWLMDRWLGTTFLVAVGILVGAGFGIYMTFARFNKVSPDSTPSSTPPGTFEQD